MFLLKASPSRFFSAVFVWAPRNFLAERIFWDLTLERRVEYMLYWCDAEKREEGFRKADGILLELFEGFNREEEMKIVFTEHDEYRWRVFFNSKHDKKERVTWDKYEWQYFLRVCKGIDLCSGLSMAKIGQLGNIDRLASDGVYRLGGCIYIPQGLNFGKELLADFKTSKLFQGTDLENCRKGIKMLRDLMIETAENMKHRLPELLEEHSALVGGFEGGDNLDVQVVEQTIEDMCDQYEPAAGDMAMTECDNQGETTDMDNTNDCDDDSAETSYPLAAEMSPGGYEEDSAAFWALAQSNEDNSSSNDDLDHAAPTMSFGAEEDLSQGGSRLLQRYINDVSVVSLSTVSSSDLVLPVSSEKERNDSCMRDPLARQSQPFFEKGSHQRRSSSKGDTQVRKFKSSSSDVTDDNVSHLRLFIVNRNLTHWYIVFQGCVDKASQVGSLSIPSDSI
ncbi:hypothetical protein BGZ82_000268, partial [Podila clonocystis]